MATALALQCIGCLDRALFKYEQITLTRRQTSKAIDESIENSISRGFSLIELNSAVNKMFGGLILAEYGLNLFYTIFGIFFATSIIDVYNTDQGGIDIIVLCFASFSITYVLISIGRIYMFQAKGQDLCDKYARIRSSLESASISFAEKLDLKEQRQLEVLISHFSAASAPIRPCDVFNMNTSNFVSVGGLIITYLVVLLQFKLTDRDHDIRENMTLADGEY